MKKILLMALIALSVVSCDFGKGKDDGGKYVLSVDFGNAVNDGDEVYLTDYSTGDTIGKALAQGGKAVFNGEVDHITMCRIKQGDSRATFLVSPDSVKLDWITRRATGSALHETMNRLLSQEDSIGQEFGRFRETNGDDEAAVNEKYKQSQDAILALFKNAYEANKDNDFGVWSVVNYLSEQDLDLSALNEFVKELPEKMQQNARIQHLIESAATKEKTKEGNKFTDFTITSSDGTTQKLSDYVGNGQYTLVDFWASWCGPCRKEIKETLKGIYEKYNGKGLTVIGVAVWDKPEDTVKAIQQLDIEWAQILNTQTVATDIYGVTGIPHIMIVDGNGTIVSRGLQGAELAAKVDELMAGK